MMTRKLLLVFGFFFILNGTQSLLAQLPTYPIILNEYCVSNVPPNGYPDEKGALSDYVEIYCNHTASINISGFYLSNDRLNLFKWKFPSNFPALMPTNYYLVWLSGKNTNSGGNFHTNFNMEQCKNQWIILSSPQGVVQDSIFVRPTKGGHVRGRVDMDVRGSSAWRLFATKSPKFSNGNPTADGYAPTPRMFLSTATSFTSSVNAGEFVTTGSQLLYMKLQGEAYDSLFSCFDIFYTKNGDYPEPFYDNNTQSGENYRYADSLTPITLDKTTLVRAIAVPKPNAPLCPINTLPSFCESNTYFIDLPHTEFTKEFGVVSIALDKADSTWFTGSQGAYSASIHVEYYDDKKQISEGYAMITRPSQEQWLTPQRGFYINKDDRLGFGCNFEGDVFNVEGLGTTPRKVFPELHLKAGDFESHSESPFGPTGTSYGTGIRDIVMQSIAAKYDLHVSPLHIKPVVAFVNGNYWGVYDLREIYDKYYEQYYNGQSPDSVDLNFVHNGQEGAVSYWDGTSSSFASASNFNTTVYNIATTKVMTQMGEYTKVMNAMDKASFIDYMILNSYSMNSDLFTNNVALAKGWQPGKLGSKWHFYLWNMPAIFNYTAIAPSGNSFPNPGVSPCFLYNSENAVLKYTPTINKFNGQGNLLTRLMQNTSFKAEYITRYQDLLNGPLKCEEILKHYDYITKLYAKEMKYHEDMASTPLPGRFATSDVNHIWDTNALALRRVLELRCFYFTEAFRKESKCYGLQGQFDISIDVTPKDAGKVRLNSTLIEDYVWYGKYFGSNITFKAIPSTDEYVFDHWEFTGPTPKTSDGLSQDSLVVNWNMNGNVLAVFTDKRNDIESGVNLPTGFSPNGDGLNDDFRPLGSGEFAKEYQMVVFNRWGQEVFRSLDPLSGWDGRYRGQEAITGVYAFYITYRNIYNEEKLLRGNVTLTR